MNSEQRINDEFPADVDRVLCSERPTLVAAQRLSAITSEPVHAISKRIPVPSRMDRDLVYRTLAVRPQEGFASLLMLVEANVANHARLLLRPLTEDRIFLGWLNTLDHETADRFIRLRTVLDLIEGIQSQTRFLPWAYAWLGVTPPPADAWGLRVPPPRDDLVKKVNAEFRDLGRPFGWGKRGPTVKAMAEAAGLTQEYEFFYLASSRSVHSNLHEMGRMVWGDSPSTMSIASETLEKLHANLAITYGTWLFSGLITALAEHLPPLRPAIESTPWGVWLALILVALWVYIW